MKTTLLTGGISLSTPPAGSSTTHTRHARIPSQHHETTLAEFPNGPKRRALVPENFGGVPDATHPVKPYSTTMEDLNACWNKVAETYLPYLL